MNFEFIFGNGFFLFNTFPNKSIKAILNTPNLIK